MYIKDMSNKHYTNVTLDEMKAVLRSDKGWNLVIEPNSKEYLFDFPLTSSPHIVIKVYSGITSDGNSRNCGKDAIRVFAVDIKNNRGYIRTKRVYRIGTWEKNLRKTVTNCFKAAQARRDKR